MNAKTADHLTKLQRRSQPIVRLNGTPKEPVWTHPTIGWEEIKAIIEPIALRHYAAGQAEEIRRAARDHDEAASFASHISHKSEKSVAWHPYGGFAQILLAICTADIDAAIASDNVRRLAEYEAYRRACEQGVAIPPTSK